MTAQRAAMPNSVGMEPKGFLGHSALLGRGAGAPGQLLLEVHGVVGIPVLPVLGAGLAGVLGAVPFSATGPVEPLSAGTAEPGLAVVQFLATHAAVTARHIVGHLEFLSPGLRLGIGNFELFPKWKGFEDGQSQ